MLPPFAHDTLKWLRNETVLRAGSTGATGDEAEARAEDPGAGAYAAPVAAGVAGLFAGGALLLFWIMWLTPLTIAAATLLALAAIRGARMESGTVRAGDRLAAGGTGPAVLALLLLVELAALEGLIAYHAPSAALVVVAAAIFGSTASIVFRLTQPARPIEEIGELSSRGSHGAALQGLTLVTIVIGTALLLPVFRIGPTAAAFVAALAAFVAVVAIARNQNAEDVPDCGAAAGKSAEAATLVAVLAFIRTP
jgi:hypothetical protein